MPALTRPVRGHRPLANGAGEARRAAAPADEPAVQGDTGGMTEADRDLRPGNGDRYEHEHADRGGAPACFAHLLCPECAAVPEDGATSCWRCGSVLPRRDAWG